MTTSLATPPDPVAVLVDELIARHGITTDTAITVLTRAARREGIDLERLAAAIVRRPTPAPV